MTTSRGDFKKRKELEELRKSGAVLPETDASGNMINPHIPNYMSRKPFYVKESEEEGIGLQHQRAWGKHAEGKGNKWAKKRDNWEGVDLTLHQELVNRRYAAQEKAREDLGRGDEKDFEDTGIGIQAMDEKKRSTVRNLRLREDTAKYLYNLDENSAWYDPKSRSMRENPFEGQDKDILEYTGENELNFSGDTQKMAQLRYFAWDQQRKGKATMDLASNPTLAELRFKKHSEGQQKKFLERQDALIKKYGGKKYLKKVDQRLLLPSQPIVVAKKPQEQLVVPKSEPVEAKSEEKAEEPKPQPPKRALQPMTKDEHFDLMEAIQNNGGLKAPRTMRQADQLYLEEKREREMRKTKLLKKRKKKTKTLRERKGIIGDKKVKKE